MSSEKWQRRFMDMAKLVSSWSLDPSTKIGAVITSSDGRQLLSVGYNGFPRGIDDTEERLNNREVKYELTVHAEMNAIYNATLNGISLKDSALYVYGLPPCSQCSLGIIQVGIKRVYMTFPDSISQKWKESFQLTSKLFIEAGVEYKWISEC